MAFVKIPQFFRQALSSEVHPQRFRQLAVEVARASYVKDDEFHRLAIKGIDGMIEAAIADHLLTSDEEERITGLCREFKIGLDQLPNGGHRLVKAAVLRDLDAGRLVSRINVEGAMPINLERDEIIIWIVNAVQYLVSKTRTRYAGRSQGASVRIMKGVYYRIGAYQGDPIRETEMVLEATGDLVIASRNVYFYGSGRAVKLPVRKVLAVEPHSDGIIVTRDGANPKPFIFKLDDPGFVADAIVRLNQL